jgi:hypothetical protein
VGGCGKGVTGHLGGSSHQGCMTGGSGQCSIFSGRCDAATVDPDIDVYMYLFS